MEFVARKMHETFDPDSSDKEQLDMAIRKMREAGSGGGDALAETQRAKGMRAGAAGAVSSCRKMGLRDHVQVVGVDGAIAEDQGHVGGTEDIAFDGVQEPWAAGVGSPAIGVAELVNESETHCLIF